MDGVMAMSIEIPSAYRRTGVMGEAITKMYHRLLFQGQKIDSIMGIWEQHLPTNLNVYNNARASGYTPMEAAFNTPTGRVAWKLGFQEIGDIRHGPIENGVFKWVEVDFHRP